MKLPLHRRLVTERVLPDKTCPVCSIVFRPAESKIKYCSALCGNVGRRKNLTGRYWKDHEKSLARAAAAHATETGKLKRPNQCEICGEAESKISNGASSLQRHHHKGYSLEHRLDVQWLCVGCHSVADDLRGANIPAAVLDDARVRRIRLLYETGVPITRLAPEFGVGTSTIWDIIKGRTWHHVD